MDEAIMEKMTYLLNYLDWRLEKDVYDVLGDSEEDPHCSAVTVTNLIQCYIDVKRSLGGAVEHGNVEEFLRNNCFTPEEIRNFEEKRQKESVFYRGVQY